MNPSFFDEKENIMKSVLFLHQQAEHHYHADHNIDKV